MTTLEAFLLAVVAAIVQALVPALIQQSQEPSTAQDGFSDPDLQEKIANAIKNP